MSKRQKPLCSVKAGYEKLVEIHQRSLFTPEMISTCLLFPKKGLDLPRFLSYFLYKENVSINRENKYNFITYNKETFGEGEPLKKNYSKIRNKKFGIGYKTLGYINP